MFHYLPLLSILHHNSKKDTNGIYSLIFYICYLLFEYRPELAADHLRRPAP